MSEQAEIYFGGEVIAIGNENKSLAEIARNLRRDKWIIPEFQRGYVWEVMKLKGWIDTILTGQAIGVVVTYQLEPKGPTYLADGLQRLTATNRFLDNPKEYGFSFTKEEAEDLCSSFSITTQHRYYRSHHEAWEAFKNLNKGTVLTPAEFHKGELVMDYRGKIIYDRVDGIVKPLVLPLMSGQKLNRGQEARLARDSLALFLQYITGTQRVDFWKVGSTQVGSNKNTVERTLMDFVLSSDLSIESIEKLFQNFKGFIAEQVAEIRKVIDETGQTGKAMSPTMIRWLLHLAIWRKNAKREFVLYQEFLVMFISLFKEFRAFQTRFPLPNTTPVKFASLKLSNLGDMLSLCISLNSDLYQGRIRASGKVASIGYNNSHILPFSKNGEGETIIEPAPRNKSRGANPIVVQEAMFK